MANTVVLGDLEKYNGDDCLRQQVVAVGATIPYTTTNTDFEYSVKVTPLSLNNLFNCWVVNTGGSEHFEIRVVETGWVLRTYNTNSIEDTIVIGSPEVGKESILTLTRTGNEYTLSADGETASITTALVNDTMTVIEIGRAPSTSQVCMRDIEYNGYKYIQNGDFGASNLPSHPEGREGTLTNADWWKQGVDQNFATPQLYKDTLVSPLTEDQKVIYTDATPYYGSDDPFWNPYNQDPTYSFTVVRQSLGALAGAYNYSFSYEY